MEVPCQWCMAIQTTFYKKTWGPGCWGCSKCKTKCSAAAPREAGKNRGKKGEGSEGLPPPTMLTVDEEVMGLLRRLVGALEKGAEALAATESHYQKMDKWEREYKRMDKQGWVEKADKEEEDEEEEEKAEETNGAETEIVRGRSASSDVSSDISPSPLYIPPHHRQSKTECTRGSDTGVR